MQDAHPVTCGLLVVACLQLKEEWNCAITIDGGPSAMIRGTTVTPKWSVDNLDTAHLVSILLPVTYSLCTQA